MGDESKRTAHIGVLAHERINGTYQEYLVREEDKIKEQGDMYEYRYR